MNLKAERLADALTKAADIFVLRGCLDSADDFYRSADLLRSQAAELARREVDAERFAWYFSDGDKVDFLVPYMQGVTERWTTDQWRAAIDAARAAAPAEGEQE